MQLEGYAELGQRLPGETIAHGRGTVLLVAAVVLTAAASITSRSDSDILPSFFAPAPYIDFEGCLTDTTPLATELGALCVATDGTEWQVQQTTSTVFGRQAELQASIAPTATPAESSDTGGAVLTRPLVLTPAGVATCEQDCRLAARTTDGTWHYYVIPAANESAVTQINEDVAANLLPVDPARATIVLSEE